MKRWRTVVLVAATVASFVLPAASAGAQECAPDDYNPSCRAQQTCEKLAAKTQLISCTQ